MNINDIPDVCLYNVLSFLDIDFYKIKYIQKRWKKFLMNKYQFSILYRRLQYKSPRIKKIMYPYRKLNFELDMTQLSDIEDQDFVKYIKKLNKLKLLKHKQKVLYWYSNHYRGYQIRLIYKLKQNYMK